MLFTAIFLSSLINTCNNNSHFFMTKTMVFEVPSGVLVCRKKKKQQKHLGSGSCKLVLKVYGKILRLLTYHDYRALKYDMLAVKHVFYLYHTLTLIISV